MTATLYGRYKKKMYDSGGSLYNSGMLPSVTAGTGASSQATSLATTYSAKAVGTTGSTIGAGIVGSAGAIGSIANDAIDTFSKGDALTGRKSMGSSIGKGAVSGAVAGTAILPGWGTAIGAVVGAGIGFFKGKADKKNAMSGLYSRSLNQGMVDSSMSRARVQEDPSLYAGYKGAGYFAYGGTMGDKKPTGTVTTTLPASRYNSEEEIAKDNKFARDFSRRHSSNEYLNENTVVARNVGDPKVQFVDQNGKLVSHNSPKLGTTLPGGVSINDVFQTSEGQYGYYHPQNGTFNPVDSQAIYSRYGQKDNSTAKLSEGGKIHIKLSHKGKFTAWAAQHDMGVQEAAKSVMSNKDNYSSSVIKMANFARNFGGKKEFGGEITAPLARAYMTGGSAKSLSSDNAELKGNSHANGGIDIPSMGAEVEGGETTVGDYVFSKKLGFAALHKPIAVAKGKIESKPATSERVNSMKLLQAREERLKQAQELVKSKLPQHA